MKSFSDLRLAAASGGFGSVTMAEIQAIIEGLVRRSLAVTDGRSVLSLAIPLGEYNPPEEILEKVRALSEQLEGIASCSSPSANVIGAVQEQLGLKLDSAKGPREYLVINHVERPSEN